MHATTNLNDASNEQLTRLRNIVWLWCISEGYEDVSTGESICFTKNQKTTTFILETNKSRAELLTCIYEATEKYFQFSGIFCIYLARYIVKDVVKATSSIICKKYFKKLLTNEHLFCYNVIRRNFGILQLNMKMC